MSYKSRTHETIDVLNRSDISSTKNRTRVEAKFVSSRHTQQPAAKHWQTDLAQRVKNWLSCHLSSYQL